MELTRSDGFVLVLHYLVLSDCAAPGTCYLSRSDCSAQQTEYWTRSDCSVSGLEHLTSSDGFAPGSEYLVVLVVLRFFRERWRTRNIVFWG